MKVRNIKNLPVFDKNTARVVGRVEKAVIGDDYKISYIVVAFAGREPGMICQEHFELGEEAISINDMVSIKSYAYGEELSIYDRKLGDVIFDSEGKELGVVSDFIVSPDNKKVWGLEVFSGAIRDLLEGRQEIPIEQVCWKSIVSAVVNEEGSDNK